MDKSIDWNGPSAYDVSTYRSPSFRRNGMRSDVQQEVDLPGGLTDEYAGYLVGLCRCEYEDNRGEEGLR